MVGIQGVVDMRMVKEIIVGSMQWWGLWDEEFKDC